MLQSSNLAKMESEIKRLNATVYLGMKPCWLGSFKQFVKIYTRNFF